MPNTKSATKRLKQNVTRRLRNRSTKSNVKTQIKKVISTVAAGDVEQAEAEYVTAAKKLDKASSKRVLHPNKAARQKSRLQKQIKKLKSA